MHSHEHTNTHSHICVYIYIMIYTIWREKGRVSFRCTRAYTYILMHIFLYGTFFWIHCRTCKPGNPSGETSLLPLERGQISRRFSGAWHRMKSWGVLHLFLETNSENCKGVSQDYIVIMYGFNVGQWENQWKLYIYVGWNHLPWLTLAGYGRT